MTRKADADQIEAFVNSLTKAPWLGGARAAWPRYLFRIDDVVAAASILERGAILSRRAAGELGVIHHDSANPGVIAHSPEWLKGQVRLYFRPRTPTEYASEGFRPANAIVLGAHRPMPVIFVFSSIPILCENGTKFTDGNAATLSHKRSDSAAFLQSIPFEKVYHEGAIEETEKAEITFRRCAEVLVENQLDLTHLRRVLCRSQAEYETLLDILTPATRERFTKMIGLSTRSHYKFWTFLENVQLSREKVTLKFSPSTRSPGPFSIVVEIIDEIGQPRGAWKSDSYTANGTSTISLKNIQGLLGYRVQVKLDGLLAYSGGYKSDEALL